MAPPGAPPRGEEREQLEALRRLASILGAQLIVEEGDDVAEAAARVAGRARHHLRASWASRARAAGVRRFEESLPERLMRKLPGVDVRIVADAR